MSDPESKRGTPVYVWKLTYCEGEKRAVLELGENQPPLPSMTLHQERALLQMVEHAVRHVGAVHVSPANASWVRYAAERVADALTDVITGTEHIVLPHVEVCVDRVDVRFPKARRPSEVS